MDDIQWMAGLLEGEGSFLKGSPSNPNVPQITLEMKDEDIIARIAACWGVRYCETRKRKRALGLMKANWSRTYRTRITGKRAVELMRILHPLMGIRRKEQITVAIASFHPNKDHWSMRSRITELLPRMRELRKQNLSYRVIARKLKCSHQRVAQLLSL